MLLALIVMSGCVLRGDGRRVAYAIDGALVLGGILLVQDASKTHCSSGWGEDLCEGLKGLEISMGATMVAGGVIAMVITAMLHPSEVAGAHEAPAGEPVDHRPECRHLFDAIHAATTQDDKRAAVRATPAYCYGP